MDKFIHVKIGVDFFNLLMTSDVYKSNPKAVSAAYYLLEQIKNKMDANEVLMVEHSSKMIRELFRPHTGGDYKSYLKALVDLELLVIDHHYIDPNYEKRRRESLGEVPEVKLKVDVNGNVTNGDVEGECKKYCATDKCIELLSSSNKEYLKKLYSDKKVRRRTQQDISKRKVMTKTYGDYVLNYIHDVLRNVNFKESDINRLLADNFRNESQKHNISTSVIAFLEKRFGDLNYNDKTGRLFHEFINMNKNLRLVSSYKEMVYRVSIDIRACYPTFFSSYILSISLNPISISTPYHKVVDICDNTFKMRENHALILSIEEKAGLEKEHQQWINLFTDEDTDPREVIRHQVGYEDVSIAKAALNETLNGSMQYPELKKWMQSKYPLLYKVWQSTDVKRTGEMISKDFESPLMFNESLYRMAEAMKIKIVAEHDGIGVFAEEEENLESRVQYLKKHIRDEAEKKYGIALRMKVTYHEQQKPSGDTSVDLLFDMTGALDRFENEYAKVKTRTDSLRRRSFADDSFHNKNEYQASRNKEQEILDRYKPVLEYWNERQKNGLC